MLEVRLFFAFALILSSTSSLAKNFSAEGKEFSFDLPSTWREAKNLYGVPLSLLAPVQPNNSRAVILVTPTPLEKIRFGKEFVQSFDKNYQEGRLAWLKEEGGAARSFEASKLESWPGVKEVMSSGYEYQLGVKSFIERSFYIGCEADFYHVKVLVNEGNRSQLAESIDIVRSFKCLK